jgi:hypothetical protein
MTKNIAGIIINIKSDVCERYLPGYKRPNFCDFVLQSP